jgi:hypothetical protein
MQSKSKRQYTTPQLTVHGTLDAVTQQDPTKQFGSSDGLTFLGQPITNVS